jgi:hypothetical protein
MTQTIGQTLGWFSLVLLISLAARRGSTTARGVLCGLVAGAIGTFALHALAGVLASVLPVGQMDFYLARKWHDLSFGIFR